MKLVLFDCDGTLVDSQHMIVTAMNAAFEAAGLAPPSRNETLRIVGLSLPVAMASLAPKASDAAVSALVANYRDAFTELRSDPTLHEPLYDGMKPLLQTLAATEGLALGVATGKSVRGVIRVVTLHGLEGLFQTVQTADTHPSKPHPSMIETAIDDVDGSPDQTLMIGDTTFDMEMAAAAGAIGLGVAWGYHPPDELKAAGARQLSETADELEAAVRHHLNLGGRP